MKKLLFLLTVLILTQNAFSQQGKGLSNTVDNYGYCYVTGYTNNPVTGNDILISKYDSYGDTIWTRSYSGNDNSADDQGIGIKCTADGFVYVVGNIGNLNNGYDVVILKYTSNGDFVWAQTCASINSAQDDKAFGIVADGSDNVYITGYSNYLGIRSIFTSKYNSQNRLQWTKFNNGPNNLSSQGNAITLDNSGNVCVTGFTATAQYGNDIMTVKYESVSGTELWAQNFNGQANSDDRAFGIVADSYDNIYVTGYVSNNFTSANTNIVLLKYTTTGANPWHAYYTDALDSKAFGIVADNSFLYITGTASTSATVTNYITLKYDIINGSKQWSTTYAGPGNNDKANSIGLITNNTGVTIGVVVTGQSVGPDNTNDYATLLYSVGDGSAVDSSRYTGTESNDIATQLAVTETGNVYVTGGSDLIINQRSGAILKTQSLQWGSKINNKLTNSVPDKFSLFQNYPNPFNPSTNIKFDLAKNSNVKLTIYDMLGKEISVPINQFLLSGTHEINYTNSSLASGTYFYELKTEYFRDVKKMILIK